MKVSTKVIGWLFVVIGFRPIWLTVLTGQNQAKGNSTEGAFTMFFGIGGIGLLLHKSWGWWLATIGAVLVVGGVIEEKIVKPSPGSLSILLGLIGISILVLLLLDRPRNWKMPVRNQSSSSAEEEHGGADHTASKE